MIAADLDVGRARRDRAALPRSRPRPARGRSPPTRAARPGAARASGASWASICDEIEQVVDDARQPVGLAHDAFGELLQHTEIVGRGHRLGEQAERADRRLQLVAHVGDEVAPNALDPSRLRDVARERHRADHLTRRVERERGQVQHLARRSVELELALGDPPGERLLQELRERVVGDDVAVARAAEDCAAALRTTSRPIRSTTTMPSIAWSSAPTSQCCVASAWATRSSASCFVCSTAAIELHTGRDADARAAPGAARDRGQDDRSNNTRAIDQPAIATTTRRAFTGPPEPLPRSPEPTGDVTLRARVGRVREDLLGRVELHEMSDSAARRRRRQPS